MKKISHVVINTEFTAQYEADSIIKNNMERTLVKENVEYAKRTGKIILANGALVEYEENKELGIYIVNLYKDQKIMPLLRTVGTITEAGAKYLWDKMLVMHNNMYTPCIKKMSCPKPPFICDVIFPTIIYTPEAMEWMGVFSSIFGVEALKALEKEIPNASQKSEDEIVQMQDFTVGKVYEEAIGYQEGILFDVNDSGILVKVFFENPTNNEIEQFNADMPFEMKLVELRNIIFPLLKFGNLQWMDAPYSVHLSKNLDHLEVPTEGNGLAMQIALYDTHTGKLCNNRVIGLSTKMSKKLIKIINEQKQKPFDRREYDRNIRDVYATYPTKKLLQMAIETFRLH